MKSLRRIPATMAVAMLALATLASTVQAAEVVTDQHADGESLRLWKRAPEQPHWTIPPVNRQWNIPSRGKLWEIPASATSLQSSDTDLPVTD